MRKFVIFRIAMVTMGIYFLLNSGFSYGQNLTLATTEWKPVVPTLTTAGLDYPSSLESPFNQSIMRAVIPKSLLGLLDTGSFSIKASFIPNGPWDSNLRLFVMQSGGEGKVNGALCVICTATIVGANEYVEIFHGPSESFFKLNYFVVLSLATGLEFNNAAIRNKIEGISVTVPADNYSATIIYTIEKD